MSSQNENHEVLIQRPPLTKQQFYEKYQLQSEKENETNLDAVKTRIKSYLVHKKSEPCSSLKSFIFGLFPILTWLPNYQVKEWLGSDIISGVTIGIMQIPQGMSYSLLAGQHPIYGLYNAFFAAILYSILGTSRHVSMGTFAITSLMLGTAVSSAVPEPVVLNGNSSVDSDILDAFYQDRIMLGASTTFVIGVFLFGLSLVNLGSVVMYLSDPMISGFTCGAAVHVFVSQLKGLFGVKVRSYSGPLNVIWVIRDIILALTSLDEEGKTRTAATVVISIICIVFLLIVKEINERYKKRLPLGIPIPGEIFVVVLGTGISYSVGFEQIFNVIIVGDIPSGLPVPSTRAVSKIPSVVGYAIPIAIVGYSVAVSIAKIFANNFGYKIRPNQELVAYGCTNLAVSFFYCIPAFPSMSRSCVQVDSGGKTQLVGLISASIILLVLLWIGPLFRTIPRACLAAIITVAIKGMLRKARDFKPYWQTSRLDGAVWMVSCLATVFLDVVFGLVAGVGFSMLCIVFRTQFVQNKMMSQVGTTEFYHGVDKTKKKQVDDCVVVSFGGPLHFVNKEQLGKLLVKSTGVDPAVEKVKRKKSERSTDDHKLKVTDSNGNSGGFSEGYDNIASTDGDLESGQTHSSQTASANSKNNDHSSPPVKCAVIDCSLVNFVDSVGVKTIKKVVSDFKDVDIQIVLASVSENVMNVLNRGGFTEKFGCDIVFLSTIDAVTWWRNKKITAVNAGNLTTQF